MMTTMNAQYAAYFWKECDIKELIRLRIENETWFCGKRGSGTYSWEKLAALLKCGATGKQCHKKWLYLIAGYKEIIIPKTGKSLEEEDHPAHSWPFFDAINMYMSGRHTINPVMLIDSVTVNPSNTGNASRPKALARDLSQISAADSDTEDLPQVVVQPKKKKNTTTPAVEAASLAIIARMNAQIDQSNAQIERTLNEQAAARRNEEAMLEMMKKHFETN